jgi:exopolysaccharide biosynthesis protein
MSHIHLQPHVIVVVILLYLVLDVYTVQIDIASRPYYFRNDEHGSTKTIEEIRSILSTNETRTRRDKKDTKIEYEIFRAAATDANSTAANFELRQIVKDYANNQVNGKLIRLHNPMNHFSILEPKEGCGHSNTVQDTVSSRPPGKKCHVATNAGFFNTHSFQCHGNLVTNGKLVQNPKKHNANFGITKVIKDFIIKSNIVERKLLCWLC